ncbi:ABC transporter, partial [Klebsiella pneumoniae]
EEFRISGGQEWAKVSVWKNNGESVRFHWVNQSDFDTNADEVFKGSHADILLPQYVLGYSSGENEILSLPFFKMRFVQFD